MSPPPRLDESGDQSDAEVLVDSWRHPSRFAEVFDRHHAVVYRFLWSRAGDAADDLAAEVFRIAFEQRHDFDPRYRSARPWLFGIAANLARRHHRLGRRHRELQRRAHAERPPSPVDDPQDRLEMLAETEPVAAAVRDLPERDREPLLLYAWADLSYEEVATALDVPVGTVRSRIHRARQDLAERLGGRGRADHERGRP